MLHRVLIDRIVRRLRPPGSFLISTFCFTKRIDIAKRGIRRAFRQFRPLRRGELSFKAVKQAIDDQTLTRVELVPA